MIKAVIFDMDGVIADTERTRFSILKVLLKKRGLVLKETDYRKSVGKRTKDFLAEMFPKALSDIEVDKIYHELHSSPKKHIVAQPYIKECCRALSAEKYTLAIASLSRKKDILLVLDRVGVRHFFSYIVSSDDITHMKPHPEIYVKTISKLGVQRSECVAIEDSPVGVSAAKSAGIKCVGVTYTHSRKELSQADVVVKSLKEINKRFLDKLSLRKY